MVGHIQKEEWSCQASAVEMVGKVERYKAGTIIDPRCASLQTTVGSNLSIPILNQHFPNGYCGLLFTEEFGTVEEKNGIRFDFDGLFDKIDDEIRNQKMVIIGIPTGHSIRNNQLFIISHTVVIYSKIVIDGGEAYPTVTTYFQQPGLSFQTYSKRELRRILKHPDSVNGMPIQGGRIVGTSIWVFDRI